MNYNRRSDPIYKTRIFVMKFTKKILKKKLKGIFENPEIRELAN